LFRDLDQVYYEGLRRAGTMSMVATFVRRLVGFARRLLLMDQ
jgi:hypothetical protein